MSLTFHSAPNAEPSIGACHQVSVHLAKQFQRRFLEINQQYLCLWKIRFVNKHGRHWQFFFLIDRFLKIFSETTLPNEAKLGRKHLCKVLYKILRNRSIRKKNCQWRPCLLTNRIFHRHRYFLPNFSSFEKPVSEEKIF
jgi:hypothetical protein